MVESKVDNNDNDYVNLVKSAKNVIFHGAPGTGKTYLAKQVAAKIVSNGKVEKYSELSDDQKSRIGFVQFYPGYDYSNFVEGFKPQPVDASSKEGMKFTLEYGIFKQFVEKAKEPTIKQNLEKHKITPELEDFVRECLTGRELKTYASDNPSRNKPFKVKEIKNNKIYFDKSREYHSPTNGPLKLDTLLEGPGMDSTFSRLNDHQQWSYYKPIWDCLVRNAEAEPYVFIIDEINRGNTSGIFGELFYAIDPGNRGPEGEVTLQYSKEKFYVPENVLLIGTMNDIDRSVEPFDFAFRRRWNSREIKPKDTSDSILYSLVKEDPKLSKDDITKRMDTLNKVISQEIGEDYQIGAAYFLKLKDLSNDFNKLWKDSLEPLLKEYVYGMDNAEILLRGFENAYGYKSDDGGLQEQG